MNARNTAESSTLSDVRCSTSSHTTASGGAALRAPLGLVGELGDLRVDHLERDRPLLVDLELLEVGEHDARVLARDVAEDHVAFGPRSPRPRRRMTLQTEGVSRSRSSARSARCGGATMRRWTIAQAYSRPHPRPARPSRGAACKFHCRIAAHDPRARAESAREGAAGRPVHPVPSDPRPSLANTCSHPRRHQAARPSARFASWCAAPSTRRWSSPRWARHLPGRPRGRPGPPPPRPSTRTAGHSVVVCARAGPAWAARAPRSASRRSPITRHAGTDRPRPPAPGLGGRARRRGWCRHPRRYGLHRTRAASQAARALSDRTSHRHTPLALLEGLEAHVSHVHCWRARRAPLRWGPALPGAGRPVCPGRRELLPAEPITTTSRPAGGSSVRNRRRPTLPGPCGPSTIGAVGLNCSVRNGKRCFPHAKATGNLSRPAASARTFKTAQIANATGITKISVKPSTH